MREDVLLYIILHFARNIFVDGCHSQLDLRVPCRTLIYVVRGPQLHPQFTHIPNKS